MAAVLVLLAIMVVVGRVSQPRLGRLGGPATSPPPPATPATSRPLVTKIIGGGPVDDVAVDSEAVWILQAGVVSRVDPRTGRLLGTIVGYQAPADRPIVGLAAGAGWVWASVADAGLLRIDPATARVTGRVALATDARPAARVDEVWTVCCRDRPGRGGRLVLVDPTTMHVLARTALPGQPDAVGVGRAGVWIRSTAGPIWRVNPDTRQLVTTIRVPGGLGATSGSVAVTIDAVWVSDPMRATVWRVDPDRDQLTDSSLDADGRGLAVGGDGTVWATSGNRLLGWELGTVRRGRTLDELGSDQINALAAGADALWVAAPTGLFRVDLAALP